jgi:hypothetical protein
MENANNLQAARVRATELSLQSSGQFAVYDLRNPARAVFEMKQQVESPLTWNRPVKRNETNNNYEIILPPEIPQRRVGR